MVGHDARSVANELLRCAWSHDDRITHLKVQKLLFYCQGWMLTLHEQPLFFQPIEAWKHGPVVRDVYDSLQWHGAGPITLPIDTARETYGQEQEKLLNEVWRVYGDYTAAQLRSLTHVSNSPWTRTWERWGESAIIPPAYMIEFFRAKLKS